MQPLALWKNKQLTSSPVSTVVSPATISGQLIDAIMDVANDEKSVRRRAGRDRTFVNGTRDGVDIDADGKTVVTAYPTNVPRNPRK